MFFRYNEKFIITYPKNCKKQVFFVILPFKSFATEPMKNQKIYEATDKMVTILRDNYNILQSLGSFGISLGFGDKTVSEVCQSEGVDTATFLAVVNFTINGFRNEDSIAHLSIPTLLKYLQASHVYFLDFELPFIRRELVEALDPDNNLSTLILKLYDEYARSVRQHMHYEEKTVFPYVRSLLNNEVKVDYGIDTYSKHHGQTGQKLKELKNIIIKYLPSDGLRNNQLSATLYDIYNCEEWLLHHAEVEDHIFIPAIRLLEAHTRRRGVTEKISSMIIFGGDADALSQREKDVIIGVVQGMTNKEIADHLSIALNTVITHRRNIARKLQIHSPAGLTIYAIVNNLIDISDVKI